MRIFLEQKPKDYVGDYPAITIHYREGEKDSAEVLASRIRDLIDQGRCICGAHVGEEHGKFCSAGHGIYKGG